MCRLPAKATQRRLPHVLSLRLRDSEAPGLEEPQLEDPGSLNHRLEENHLLPAAPSLAGGTAETEPQNLGGES